MIPTPRPEYPRPQFRRRDWTNLNGEWSFAFDDDDLGLARGWYDVSAEDLVNDSPLDRRITVPFCFQAPLSGIGETAFHDVVWYAREFESPLEDTGEQRLLLHFGTVDYSANVWVNGTHVAHHEGGHTPFTADVTPVLEERNVVVVRVEDPSQDVTIPRGKQYWKERSEGIFYTRTTGIWQTVWLEPVGRRRIDSLRLTPDVDAAVLDVEVAVEGFEPGLSLRLTVELDGERVLDDGVGAQSAVVERRLPLTRRGEAPETPHLSEWPRPALWSPEEPNLYDLRLELLDADGNVLDAVENYYPHLTTTELLPGGRERTVWSGTEGLQELIHGFHARYEKPIFLTETSVSGRIEDRMRWLRDSLETVHALRSEGLPIVGYTWWPLFSLVDWDYREGKGQVEEYLRHMGMYDLEPDLEGDFLRTETPVVQAFHAATRKVTGGATR